MRSYITRGSFEVLLVTGCLMQACGSEPKGGVGGVGKVTSNEAQATAQVAVAVPVSPNAECVIGALGASSTKLKLYADEGETVRFFVSQPGASAVAPALVLSCQGEDGSHFQRVVDVGEGIALAAVTPVQLPSTATIRPPLDGDPMRFTQDEIVRQGFPPRPDPVASASQFARWREVVSKPTTIVPAKLRARPDIVHNPAEMLGTDNGISGSGNWSGIALDKTSTVYSNVNGDWFVPTVSGTTAIPGTLFSAIWVGMDGLTSGDVVQSGTEQDVAWTGSTFVTNYFAWTEWFPDVSQMIANAPIVPGDQVYVDVWVGDSGSGINPNGGFGWFTMNVLHSDGSQVQYRSDTPIPSGVTYIGDSAEFIVERPTVGGGMSALPDYSTALIDFSYADSNSGTVLHDRSTDPFMQIWMINDGSDVLSEATPTTGMLFGTSHDTVTFSWEAFE
jgi:hypothetical protein